MDLSELLKTAPAQFFINLALAVLLFLVGWLLVNKVLLRLVKRILERSKVNPALHVFLLSVLRILAVVLLALICLSQLKLDIAPLITALGAAGLAVSLALQDSLKNLAGGMFILLTHPFGLGDFVEVGDKSGTVEEIGLVYTCLRTPDGKKIYIPNGDVSAATVVNYSAEEKRRSDLKFSISYDSDVEKAKKVLRQVADQNEMVLKEPEPLIRIAEFGGSSIDLTCFVWVRTEDFWTATFDLRDQVKAAFDREGISFPYPQLDVHLVEPQEK